MEFLLKLLSRGKHHTNIILRPSTYRTISIIFVCVFYPCLCLGRGFKTESKIMTNITFMGKCYIFSSKEWRIQDFTEVGAPTLRGWQDTILPNFPQNCMKLREFGGAHPIVLCRSATGKCTFFSGGDYIFDCGTIFWSHDQGVKNWPTIENVLSFSEKCNIHHVFFHTWVKPMTQTLTQVADFLQFLR